MKLSFLSLSFILILFTIARADIEIAKGQCADLGFTPGTEKYADCVMKLLPKGDSKKKKSNTDKAISEKDKKAGENVANSIKFKEATYLGEVKKGKANGIGVFTFSDGSIYEGKVSKNRHLWTLCSCSLGSQGRAARAFASPPVGTSASPKDTSSLTSQAVGVPFRREKQCLLRLLFRRSPLREVSAPDALFSLSARNAQRICI